MSEIVRFSVSLEDDLLAQFDRYCKQQQFATRSEAVRQLIRETLTARAWESESADAAGTLVGLYTGCQRGCCCHERWRGEGDCPRPFDA